MCNPGRLKFFQHGNVDKHEICAIQVLAANNGKGGWAGSGPLKINGFASVSLLSSIHLLRYPGI